MQKSSDLLFYKFFTLLSKESLLSLSNLKLLLYFFKEIYFQAKCIVFLVFTKVNVVLFRWIQAHIIFKEPVSCYLKIFPKLFLNYIQFSSNTK